MTHHKRNHDVRYGPPWRQGERDRRYYVFPAPAWLQRWWDLTDPIDREISRWQLNVWTFLTILVGILFRLAGIAFGLYLFVYLIMPFLLDCISGIC